MDYPNQVFHLIGHEIIKLLPYNDIPTCRTICRLFKRVVDDPYFCLKLLKTIGHPEECHRKWIDLIRKCQEVGIAQETFVLVLLKKFFNSSAPPKIKMQKRVLKHQFGMPPIFHAVRYGHFDVVKAIAKVDKYFYKPLPHWWKERKWRPFIEAVLNGHVEIAEFIDSKIQDEKLKKGRDLSMWFARSELMFMLMSPSKIEILKFLVPRIENPLACMTGGRTALHVAASRGNIEQLEFFADFTDNIHKILDYNGDSVIDEALQHIENGLTPIGPMEVLSSMMKRDPNGATPLHYGAQKGFLRVCELYKKYIDIQDRNGETPIHYAVQRSKSNRFAASPLEILQFLIPLSRNPNVVNSMKQTPLHVAIANLNTSKIANHQQIESFSILAKSCPDLKIQDYQGWTPLHYAVSHYNQDMFEEIVNMIDPGSNVNVFDNDGLKPLDIALEDCNEHAVRVLAPLTEDLIIAEETRNHPAYVANEKFKACLQIIDQIRIERTQMI